MSFLLASPPDVIAPVCVCGTVSVADSYFFSLRQCASLGPQCLAPIFGCVRCPRSSSRSFLFPCHHVVCLVPCQPCHLKEMHNNSRDPTAEIQQHTRARHTSRKRAHAQGNTGTTYHTQQHTTSQYQHKQSAGGRHTAGKVQGQRSGTERERLFLLHNRTDL